MQSEFGDRTAENIDQLILTELRSLNYIQIPTRELYAAARKKIGQPLCLRAARELRSRVKPGDFVLILSGFVALPWMPHSESDGPPSAGAIGRSLSAGLGARTVMITDTPVLPVMNASALAAGLNRVDLNLLKKYPQSGSVAHATSVIDFPYDEADAKRRSKELIDELQPKAIIAIERGGRNEKGVYHSGRGSDISNAVAKIDYLVDEARDRGILTVGCLDLGNEIGGGSIIDTVKSVWQWGAKCQCPCGAGMASVVEVDVPVIASNSAWGAYGIAACLAGLLGDVDIAHDSQWEKMLVQECVRAGMVDAGTMAPTLTLSQAHVDDYGHLIDLLKSIVKYAIATRPQPQTLRYADSSIPAPR